MERTVEAKGWVESHQMPKCRKEKQRIHWTTRREEETMVSVSTSLTGTTGKVPRGIIPALSSTHRVRTTYTVDCGHHGVHSLKAKLYTYADTSNFILIDLSSSISSISVKSKWTRSTNALHCLHPSSLLWPWQTWLINPSNSASWGDLRVFGTALEATPWEKLGHTQKIICHLLWKW